MNINVRRRRKLLRITLAIYWLAIFIGTHVPRVPPIDVLQSSDKLLHFSAFMGLAILMATMWATRSALTWRHYCTMLIVAAVYGAIDEWLQIPVGRHCSLADWYADLAGAFCGLVGHAIAMKQFNRRKAAHEEQTSANSV